MKKLLVGIIVCVLFFTSFLPTISSTDKNDIFQSIDRNSVDFLTNLDECVSCELNSNDRYTIMRPDLETLQKWNEDYNNAPKAFIDPEIELLDSKNLLPHLDYFPSERNQGSCGNCWAWAGTGILGIALDVQEGIHDRLSVQYINSCDIRNGCCRGGNLFIFKFFYTTTRKAISWSNTNAHWQDGDHACDTSCESISTKTNYTIHSIENTTITTRDVGQSIAISNIKNVLNQNKAVFFGFTLPTETDWQNFFEFWKYSSESALWNTDFYCGQTWANGGGHAVLCVGYNDGPGTDNDYWIMLNSWGTTSGRPNGLFRLDMHIDYDCAYHAMNTNIYSLSWQTLNVDFGSGYNNPPNTPSIPLGPSTLEIGNSGTYSTTATDPNNDQVQYRFDWDASGSHDYSTWATLVNSGESASLSHSWSKAGTYLVTAQAKDKHGKQSGWSVGRTVFITGSGDNNPPETPDIAGQTSGRRGKEFSYELVSIDPDGDKIKYIINWGDGITDTTEFYNSGETVTESHKWQYKGDYTIRVKAVDEHNAESNWGSLSVSMPRNKLYNDIPFLQFLQNFLQDYPILYQLLQRVLRL